MDRYRNQINFRHMHILNIIYNIYSYISLFHDLSILFNLLWVCYNVYKTSFGGYL